VKRDKVPASGDDVQRDAALAALLQAVEADPRGHDFFALLRRIEALRPQSPRWGRALRPSQEALRLGQDAELDFAPAAIQSFEMPGATAPRLGVRFLGLLGPHGPMPLHFTEYARERWRSHGDATLTRFLDVFHHRLLALFYRAWAQAQPAVQADRPPDDRFAAWLGASFGWDRASGDAGALPVTARLHRAGLLGSRSRHAEGLSKLLAGFFRVPVHIEQHVPHWLVLEREDCSRLGFARHRPERLDTAGAQLGRNVTGGRKRVDRQFKFRVVLGPLSLVRYHAFLPGGGDWAALGDWVRQYTGQDLQWDLRLVLAKDELPAPRLGCCVRLGVSTWIGRMHQSHDRGELRLRPQTSFLVRRGVQHA